MNRISDEVVGAIKRDREEIGMTLYQLVKKHKVSKSTVFGIIKGCDSSKVVRACPSRRVVGDISGKERPKLSKTDIGEAARQMICARLMLSGAKVFKPMTEDTPIDLLVLRGDGKVLRCQCKYIFPRGNGSHIMPLCSVRKSGAKVKAVRHLYSAEEVDFFLGYCFDNDGVYVIPYEEMKGRQSLTFWVLREPVGSNGSDFDARKFLGAFDLLK